MTKLPSGMAPPWTTVLDPPATAAELEWQREQKRSIVRHAVLKTAGLLAVLGVGMAIGAQTTHHLWIRITSPLLGALVVAFVAVSEIRSGFKNGASIWSRRTANQADESKKRFLAALDEQ